MTSPPSRSPYGERGLKSDGWLSNAPIGTRRSPYGERGLKYLMSSPILRGGNRRSPYGERGLKYTRRLLTRGNLKSLSLRRAWIEIRWACVWRGTRRVALLTESVD